MYIYVLDAGNALRTMTFTRYTVVKENAGSYDVKDGQACIDGVWYGDLKRVVKTKNVYTDKMLAYTNASSELARQIKGLSIQMAEKSKCLQDAMAILAGMAV